MVMERFQMKMTVLENLENRFPVMENERKSKMLWKGVSCVVLENYFSILLFPFS